MFLSLSEHNPPSDCGLLHINEVYRAEKMLVRFQVLSIAGCSYLSPSTGNQRRKVDSADQSLLILGFDRDLAEERTYLGAFARRIFN